MTIEAPAKTNFTLEVFGRREDGYHDLRSVVMPVSLFDTVYVEERPGETDTCEIAPCGIDGAPLDALQPGDNLCLRATSAMRRALAVRSLQSRGCAIRVAKRIPIGAGMGGGSADAAGVLACLRALWAPQMPERDWLAVGAEVGSDVPAMMLGGAVLAEGRGERSNASSLRAAARRRCGSRPFSPEKASPPSPFSPPSTATAQTAPPHPA
ncbi:MAG: hypothetical protein IJS46_04090 [Kiritimatiellae bacterium]|nr:hypothetical protein [Kiritimatiellia bacterium]